LHRNAQRLLKPIAVVNPYALGLTFLDGQTRTRRDHTKYLTLIHAIALLHQHQRPRLTREHRGKPFEYIEATLNDIAIANRLTAEVLGRSLDELPPQTRRLLLLVDAMVTAECKRQKIERTEYRFSRRDVRACTNWSDSQLKTHLRRLEDLEYLIVHRGGRGQSFVYELFFEQPADETQPTLPGMEHRYDAEKSGLEGRKSGGGLAQVRGMSGGGVSAKSPASTRVTALFYDDALKTTTADAAEQNRIVAVQPHSMNGNGNGHRGGTAWPA
jgi:hypothetical protein